MLFLKRRASLRCLNNIFYCTTTVHDGFKYTSKFSMEDEKKILNILNESNAEQLSRFDVSRMRIKNLESWKNKRGPFKSIIEILEVDGLGVKNFERLCESIITNKENVDLVKQVSNPSIKNRRNIYVLPILQNEVVIRSAVGLHLDPTGISWAKLNKDNNQISNWDYHQTSNLPKRMLPNETFNLAMTLMPMIPKGDVYIFESAVSINSINQKQAAAFPLMHNIELTSMLLALINTSSEMNNTINDNKVYFLRSKLPARLFKTLVGNEKVSSSSTVDNLLLQNDETMPCTRINLEDSIKSHYYTQSTVNRDLLGQALLIAITFMDLCVYKNVNSLQVLLGKKKINS